MTNDLLYNIIMQMQGQNTVLASVNNVQRQTTSMVQNINRQLSSIKLNAIIDNVSRVADGINSLNGPGLTLSTSMFDLSAMTGVAGEKLKEIEGYARNASKTFGGSASQGVESYKLILGQLSPEIAKVPTALKSMGETVSYTSKLMGGDANAATEVLTTAMNQYGISLEDPTKASQVMAAMMNVMAAAAQEGSAELPQIKQALEQSGMAAKSANVAFEETNSAIQILDKAGKKGSEGGVALRNVLATLGQGRFLPKTVQEEFKKLGINITEINDPGKTLSERLTLLKPLLKDSALMSAMFGKENSNAAMALISQTGEMDRLTSSVKGTNSAYEQAAIIMESPAEKNARLKASVDDLKISLFNATNGWMGYTSVIGDTARDMANLAPIFTATGTTLSFLTNTQKLSATWTSIVTGAQWLWNASIMAFPVLWIVAGILALVAVIVTCWDKFEGFRKVIFKGWEAMKMFGTVIKDYVINRFKELLSGITGIGSALISFFKGDWQKAWDTGKKAMFDLSGAGSAGTALNSVKNGWGTAMKAGQNASDIYTKGLAKKTASENTNGGIANPAGIPGSDLAGSGSSAAGKDKATKAAGKKNTESIATGGTKHNYITLNIKELIGIQNYAGSAGSSISKAGEGVLDELLRATASATTAVS